MQQAIEIYTDGACKGNPGVGGWGVLLRYQGKEKQMYGGEKQTTNNRMELTAVIEALRALKRPDCVIDLYTDSRYVLDGLNQWLPGWKQRGWKTSSKKPVLNQDLWQTLDELAQQHQLRWHWVRGHSGMPGNELADELANLGVQEVMR